MVWGHPHISTSVDTHQLYETEFSDITTGGFDYKTLIAETLNVVFTDKFVAWGVEPEYHFSIVQLQASKTASCRKCECESVHSHDIRGN